MVNYAMQAIQAALLGKNVFCKFLSANDTGLTGGHQAGIYVSKPAVPILFQETGTKGQNKEKWVKIRWCNDFETDSRFIYYGQGTRNEYRITNFGHGFPFLKPEYTGALFVLVQLTDQDYQGFVLNTEDEINSFLDSFGLSPAETNRLIDLHNISPQTKEKQEIDRFIQSLQVDFPTSEEMSAAARRIQDSVYNHTEYIQTNPDRKLLDWTDSEYRLFKALEFARYGEIITHGFDSVEAFVNIANQVLNRRKSRAGKSLEHHLSAIFDGNKLIYQAQATTEGNKKPDFLFPSQDAYHDPAYPTEKLICLAAKTTCKDRWRQVINEANRLRGQTKFLCTLQQGISSAQMDEMQEEQVVLVVPKPYIATYPRDKQGRIWTISKFIEYVKAMET